MYDAALTRPMLRQAAVLLAQTEHEKLLYEKAVAKRMRFSSFRCHSIGSRILPPRGLFRARLGLADDVPLVLFLGRIHFLKGLDLLIEALDPLLKAGERPSPGCRRA